MGPHKTIDPGKHIYTAPALLLMCTTQALLSHPSNVHLLSRAERLA